MKSQANVVAGFNSVKKEMCCLNECSWALLSGLFFKFSVIVGSQDNPGFCKLTPPHNKKNFGSPHIQPIYMCRTANLS